jgi:hypothetical protein
MTSPDTLNEANTSAKKLEPIVYGKQVLNGLVVRPDSRSVIRKAIEGYPVVVESNNDYINLYHVFERLVKSEQLDHLCLVRKQVGESKWVLYAVNDKHEAPRANLSSGYDPKRGRYKRYAEKLASGAALTFSDRGEAIKARRAWQLYTPAEQRKHLRSSVRAAGRGNRFLVCILERRKTSNKVDEGK